MKKKIFSILLILSMILSLLPTTALADNMGKRVEVKTYAELTTALEDQEVTELVIVGSRKDFSTNYELVTFDWQNNSTLTLKAKNSACEVEVSGTWNIPAGVVVNLEHDVLLGGASSDIVVDGTWSMAKSGCSVTSFFDDARLIIGAAGVLTTSLDSFLQVIPCGGTLELNGEMRLPGNPCLIENMVMGNGAKVVTTSSNAPTLTVYSGGTISCPSGSATIEGTVCGVNSPAHIEASKEGTITLSGNLAVDEILLEGNKTVMISSGSHITTKKLTAADTTYTPALALGGTLELNGAAGTTHTFTGGKVGTEIVGTLILRPGNALGDAESVVGVFAGPGTIQLFADYDGTTYSNYPSVFGKTGRTDIEHDWPAQVDDSVTIWRSWTGEEEPGTGEEEPPKGHVVNYTYPEDLCDLRVTDNNNGNDIASGGTITIDETKGSPAVLQIDAKEGYELDSVTLNGNDVTDSFESISTNTGTVYLALLQITEDTSFVVTMKQTGDSGDSGDSGSLHKLSAPTNLHWGTYYTDQTQGTGFAYPGMISWKVADTAYDQDLELCLYKDGEQLYATEWSYYADSENPRIYLCDWDFSLSELDRGSGTYTFTIQAKGDGTTTSDSDVVTSPAWNYTRPTAQLTAPEIIGWSGATARWNEVDGEYVGGYVVDFYYSADDANATSADDLRRVSGFVKYNGEAGDPLTSYEPMASWLERYGSGYYYFTAQTVSGDVTKVCHSEPSGLSGAYYYTGSAGGEEPCAHSGGTATCTQQAVCGTCGKPYGDLADHSWETKWTTDADQHWHKCENCPAQNETANHISDGVTDCTVASKCTVCTAVLRAAGSHTPVTDPYVAPTLTTTGKTEGSHCGTCDKVLVAQEEIGTLQYQDVSFFPDAFTWTYGDEAIKNGLYNAADNASSDGGALTYSSSNTDVATVDASTGKVSVAGAGEAIITATAAAVKDKYAETSATYTLTINKAPLTVTAKDTTIGYGAAPANDGFTATGFVLGEDANVLSGTASYTYNYQQYGKAGTYTITPSGLSARNYAITFVPGTLTVEKATSHTITLGNLTQNVGSVSAVTAVVAPQDSTASVKVEYETVTAAKPCGHQHETACGENGATCTHTSHDSACGYAAETRTWGTSVPTAKGTYNVRASLTASDNIVVPAEPAYTTGTLEIKAQATIGGGSYSGPSSGSNKNDKLDMGSGSNSVAVDVKVENGSAEVVVTDKNLKEILENVPASGEMVVDLTSVDGAQELVLPSKLVAALSENEETTELTVVSEAAEITMDANVMETLAETLSGTNDKVSVQLTAVEKDDLSQAQQKALDSIAVDAVIVELNLTVHHYNDKGTATGQTQLHELGGKVDVRVAYTLPKDMAGKQVVVSYVSDNGTVTYLRASYADGFVSFKTDHFSTYAVFANYAASFQDIDLNGWYAADVDFVAANGLMKGSAETAFHPDGKVSRQQIWMILARMADYAPEDMTAARGWAVSAGVSDGSNAVSPVTRQQLVTLLWRAEGTPRADLSVLADYPDTASVAEYAREAMAWAVANGVVNGTAQGTLNPSGTASRAQLAAILHRYMG